MSDSYSVDKLIGPLEENFYSLGIKDRDGYIGLSEHIRSLSKTNSFHGVIEKTIKIAQNSLFDKNDIFYKIIENYCQGLSISVSDYMAFLLLPEIISSQSKWIPELLSIIPGCSSLFVYDEKNESSIHTRILDFPLVDQYEKFERSVYLDINGLPKIISHSTRGYPLPGLTSMNEHGLTIAIHQKFSNYFNFKGEPIIKIAFDIISQATNVFEAKKILRQKSSMTYWGLYICDSQSNVLAVDICGNELYTEMFDLKENKILYFNNLPLFKDKINESSGPLSYLDTCKMKYAQFEKSKSKLKFSANDLELECLKTITKLAPIEKAHARDWKQSPLNIASVQVSTFNNNLQTSKLVLGDTPKVIKNSRAELKNIFTNFDYTIKESKEAKDITYNKGLQLLSKAQTLYDYKNPEHAYHYIQMASTIMNSHQEKWIADFFFCVWQYLYAETKEDYKAVYSQLLILQDKLPEFLEDHRQLFLLRIEKVCAMPITANIEIVSNHDLKDIFKKEQKLRPMVIKLMRKLIYPRLELPDIIYMY